MNGVEQRRAEGAALHALGGLKLPGLVRAAGAGASTHVHGVPLDRCETRTWPAVAAILAPVAEALAAVHAHGWVHGDVAPANVVVTLDGDGVLVDLGCAAPIGGARPTGTPGWAAPEVLAGSPVTPAAEVWSLAAVAVGAVTGMPPTTGTPVTTLPAQAALALQRALLPDPAARPTTGELAPVFRAAASPSPPPLAAGPPDPRSAVTTEFGPRPPGPPAALPAPAQRAGPLIAAVLAVAVAAGWWSTRPTGPDEDVVPSPCPPVAAGAALVGDPDGDGCDAGASWADGVLRIQLAPGTSPVRVAVGAPGDDVVLGDWDCDGRDTPAAYRPATGRITVWNEWPDGGGDVAPARSVPAAIGGVAVVDTDEATGCDHVAVRVDR